MNTDTQQRDVNLMLGKQIFHIAISYFLVKQQPSDPTKEASHPGWKEKELPIPVRDTAEGQEVTL